MNDLPPLTVVCWKWKPAPNFAVTYTSAHVNTWARMVKRFYQRPLRVVCVTDDPAGITECETYPLWKEAGHLANVTGKHLPSCYRRLRIFQPDVAEDFGPRIVSLDLDVVITGRMEPVWDRDVDFMGWLVKGTLHERVYNGSMWMFKAGKMSWLWSEFDPAVSPQKALAAGYYGSDQGWLSYRLKGAAPGWTREDGVFSYPRDIRGYVGRSIPEGCRLVVFHGKRKPWDNRAREDTPWIKKFWRD